MDRHDLYIALREYLKHRRQEILESFATCTDVEKTRGKLLELTAMQVKLKELAQTTGDDDD